MGYYVTKTEPVEAEDIAVLELLCKSQFFQVGL